MTDLEVWLGETERELLALRVHVRSWAHTRRDDRRRADLCRAELRAPDRLRYEELAAGVSLKALCSLYATVRGLAYCRRRVALVNETARRDARYIGARQVALERQATAPILAMGPDDVAVVLACRHPWMPSYALRALPPAPDA